MTLSCPDCDAVFVRTEHLQRCILSELTCIERDVLIRHMQIHDLSEVPAKHRRTTYVAKACSQCAKSKQRCDGQLPCSRCTSKELDCSYATLSYCSYAKSRNRRASQSMQSSVVDQGKTSVPSVPNQELQNAATSSYLENQSEVNPVQFGDFSEMGNAPLPFWSPNDVETITSLLSQPPMVLDQNLGSVFDTHGDLQGFSFSNIGAFLGLEGHRSLVDETPSLSSQSAPDYSLAETTIPQHVALTQEMPASAPSEPAVECLETEAPAPTFTQTFKSPDSSHERSSDVNVSIFNEGISQDYDVWRAEDYCHVPRLTEDVYEEMTKHFARYNSDDEYWTPFTCRNFPPITHINTFIQVYFEEFHSLLPFLHRATFAPTRDKWMLSLGIAAVGSIFSRAKNSRTTIYDLQEFLRRAIHVERVRNLLPDVSLVQAALLNLLGIMFSPQMLLCEAVPTTMTLIETLCRKMACYTNFDEFGRPLETKSSGYDNWAEWIKKESLQRLFYSLWILDCQHSCFWAGPGIITLDCLQLPAPSHPSLWEASSQEAWLKNQNTSSYNALSFRSVLLEFYRTQKILSPDPFNILLLNIGVKYHAEKLHRAPIYLNILQEHAEALPPTKLSGAVQSLSHLLSMFIHLPVRELYAFTGWRVTSSQRAINNTKLRTWIQSKTEARASLMHACKAWSMIRNRKTGSQHETMGFLLAAVMIWAWIELGKKPEVEDLNLLVTVRLDQGTDMLKAWITQNNDSRLYLGGVGCLWEEGASRRLIHESTKTLEGLDWPLARVLALNLREHYKSYPDKRLQG
ncbi:hypothetical protein QL093DRAFT_2008211 [Fusarium oxysporum]|nr:hypothetical protein QL093DRAFT_2008211 [Fusarium oxysporum]